MPSILFVCTANRFRSPLAAAVLKQALVEEGEDPAAWQVGSAGTWAQPGQPVIPALLEAVRQLGLDLAGHRSTCVSGALLTNYDLILVMQAGQKEALLHEFPALHGHVYLLSYVVERGTYDIPDALTSEQEAVEISLELNRLIRRGLEQICVLGVALHNERMRTR